MQRKSKGYFVVQKNITETIKGFTTDFTVSFAVRQNSPKNNSCMPNHIANHSQLDNMVCCVDQTNLHNQHLQTEVLLISYCTHLVKNSYIQSGSQEENRCPICLKVNI